MHVDKDRNMMRMVLMLPHGRKRFSFPKAILEDKANRKLRNALEDLYEELEKFSKFGRELSKDANKTLDLVRAKYPKTYEKTIHECGLNRNDELTLKRAFDEYIATMTWSKRTISKWNGTRDFLVQEFGEYKPLKEIDSINLQGLFKKLAARDYAPATLNKHLQRVKQLWGWYHGAGKLLTNPAKVVNLGYQQIQLVAVKPYIPMEDFVKAAGCITDQQAKTLLYYYRCMGARQNDPKGDRWEDVDWKNRTINRSSRKGVEKKLGPCPIRPELYDELVKWRDEVIAAKGKAEGEIFPWLFQTRPANQSKYFKSRIAAHPTVEVWPNFFNSLRASAVTDIRAQMGDQGRFFAGKWIGHNAQTADDHYAQILPANIQKITKHRKDDDGKEVA